MEITCRVYKPRRPWESPLYRLVEQHLEELLRVWPPASSGSMGPCDRWLSRCYGSSSSAAFSSTASRGCGAPSAGGACCRLLDRHAISSELVRKLLGWRHPGFSAHVGESIAAQERQRLEDTAAYLVRNPLSLRKLVYLDGQQAVLYRSRMNPSLGRNFEALDPLEWLARMSAHIPDPGQHRTVFYGHYANRARGAGRRDAAQMPEAFTERPRRRCSPRWARLIAKVYQVDPLVCGRCGQKMQMIAFLADQLSIRKVLDHLGLSTPPQDKPPPVREILRVAEHAEGWGVPAEWA